MKDKTRTKHSVGKTIAHNASVRRMIAAFRTTLATLCSTCGQLRFSCTKSTTCTTCTITGAFKCNTVEQVVHFVRLHNAPKLVFLLCLPGEKCSGLSENKIFAKETKVQAATHQLYSACFAVLLLQRGSTFLFCCYVT